MTPGIFSTLLLTGRPASGKSELIDFLTRTPLPERQATYHIGQLDVLDDFPMLWTWFEEDDLLSRKFGLPRLHSDEEGYFTHPQLWHLLIERLALDYQKKVRDVPNYHAHATALIEFSRGSQHGGYQAALPHLSKEILQQAVIVYVRVSFSESLRKNRARFNPNRPDSILEHGLSDVKMERLYSQDDWEQIASGESGFVEVNGFKVPFAVFENEDDVTTAKPALLGARLASVLGTLWNLRQQP